MVKRQVELGTVNQHGQLLVRRTDETAPVHRSTSCSPFWPCRRYVCTDRVTLDQMKRAGIRLSLRGAE